MACASCWKRRNRSGSRAKAAGKTLIATSRLSRASRARYTSPMPPAPTGDTISYGPSFVPGVRAIRARNYRLVQHAALDARILGSANRKLSGKGLLGIVAGTATARRILASTVDAEPL